MTGVTVATDVGGTFTDVVLAGGDGRVHVVKTLTTPDDPGDGLLRGVADVLALAGVAPSEVTRFVHATTLATNVILERRGVPVAFVTTEGFRALLALGRQARVEEERFDLGFAQPEPPVPLTHTFTVGGRIDASGGEVAPLDEAGAARVAEQIAGLGVAAVAVCLLHSYAEPAHERRLAEILRARLGDVPVVLSSDVWPEMGEYERATTTLMSAYVGPVMDSYLRRLTGRLRDLGIGAPVQVMESAGGVLPVELAAARAVHTIESGPAAGVIAAADAGAARGLADLISFDMGGTTAKAGLVRGGRPGITHEFQVGGKGSFGGRRPGSGVPIKIPAIDLAEVGAGGGSIASVSGGTLRVGPRSAGADPGPACYGRGGVEPTVTDANLILGYLSPDEFAFPLSRELAEEAMRKVADPLGVDVATAAAAVHDIANAQMGTAVHVVTVRRGIDPRGYTLVALGGAAPTHAARLAERFGITRVLVPPNSGVGSAAGLLRADLSVERARTFLRPTASLTEEALAGLAALLDHLEHVARADLSASTGGEVNRSVGVRFIGQAHAFTVDLPPGPLTTALIEHVTEDFYKKYEESYGIPLRDPAELTTARVRVTVEAPHPTPAPMELVRAEETARVVHLDGERREIPAHPRASCPPGTPLEGPRILTDAQCSVLVPPGWRATATPEGATLLERLPAEPLEAR
ncbi:hydantoinase/oxoprolinase family protein [Actinocorallia sp. A-T 12471]|uniref:hydantoinase/oxoprolinase family protein n=1 Tax=Actinocorallia sp. A-T 12471 TaxID=3089813 RepID=UPI0029D2581E|nr:hydantoinase/oxoprolinase family protein [Actinocorallia sp. A-T 12471]MDX6743349.1 hydantoinase/oxoprolinase family protein [Actinocorallia sp. A-T 12471]